MNLLKLIAALGPQAVVVLKAVAHLAADPVLLAAYRDAKGRRPTDPAALADFETIVNEVVADLGPLLPAAG